MPSLLSHFPSAAVVPEQLHKRPMSELVSSRSLAWPSCLVSRPAALLLRRFIRPRSSRLTKPLVVGGGGLHGATVSRLAPKLQRDYNAVGPAYALLDVSAFRNPLSRTSRLENAAEVSN